jgi:hypothetical protein
MTVFWDIAPCSLVEVYGWFGGAYCLHHQVYHRPDDGGNKHLWNVGKLLPDYTVQHPRRVNFIFEYCRHVVKYTYLFCLLIKKWRTRRCKWTSEWMSDGVENLHEEIVSLIILLCVYEVWRKNFTFKWEVISSFCFILSFYPSTEKLLSLCRVFMYQKKGSLHLHPGNLRPSKIVMELYDRSALKINCSLFRTLSSFE